MFSLAIFPTGATHVLIPRHLPLRAPPPAPHALPRGRPRPRLPPPPQPGCPGPRRPRAPASGLAGHPRARARALPAPKGPRDAAPGRAGRARHGGRLTVRLGSRARLRHGQEAASGNRDGRGSGVPGCRGLSWRRRRRPSRGHRRPGRNR